MKRILPQSILQIQTISHCVIDERSKLCGVETTLRCLSQSENTKHLREITNHKKCFDMIVEWLIGTWFGLTQREISIGSLSFPFSFVWYWELCWRGRFFLLFRKNRMMTIVNVVVERLWIENELENWDGWSDCLEWTHSEGVYWFLEWTCLFWNSL